MNIVCADFVTNGSLAIAWHTFNQYERTQFEAKVYHINRVSDPKLIFGKMILAYLSIYISLNLYAIAVGFSITFDAFVFD